MRTPVLALPLVVILGVTMSLAAPPETARGFALVELFTSEGCSSCPPADGLLARIAADAERSGRLVYTLSLHVDYWDGLGWKDPYSDAEFTRRQEGYVSALGVRGPYTPQMVVNGVDEFVGSDRARAEKAIEAALAVKAPVSIDLTVIRERTNLGVAWKTAGALPGSELHVAWLQAEAASSPDRGENASRRLKHVHVVREFHTILLGPSFAGRVTLTPPDGQLGSVVAFVQNPKTGKIVGAAAANATEPNR